ncbi:MAG TPA: lysoplasmalogenase [Acidimicrobiia bacterium]|nr:lysoplasmalogenase [Acidimicrobiia bacterium]
MTLSLVIAIVALAFGSALLTDRNDSLSRVAKMAASTLVIVLAVTGAEEFDVYTLGILAALAASWMGDLALSHPGRRPFTIGLAAFAAAHVAYAASFVARGASSVPWMLAAGLVMAAVGTGVIRWLAPHRPQQLAVPLLVYVVIIGVMVTTAFGSLGTDPDPRIPLAASLFAASDVLVARQQFVTRAMSNRVIGLPLYFVAQVMFALTVA